MCMRKDNYLTYLTQKELRGFSSNHVQNIVCVKRQSVQNFSPRVGAYPESDISQNYREVRNGKALINLLFSYGNFFCCIQVM